MSTDNIEQGNDQQPTPKIADKYADYVELNQENDSEAGTSEPSTEVKNTDKTVDDKQEVKESSTETEKPAHKPAWQKRIDKQTAKIRTLEAQLEELRSVKAQKELPKYKRENFVSDEEYEDYQEKVLEDKLNRKFADTQEKNLLEAKHQAETEAFNTQWVDRVRQNFDGDEEGYVEFANLIKQNATAMDKWHEDIHDFMEATEVGPRMMQVLFYRPDIVSQINSAKPIVRMKMLNQLEGEILNVMNSRVAPKVAPQPAKPAVSKAPAPIGTIGSTGSVLSDEESEDVAYQRYMKKKFGGK